MQFAEYLALFVRVDGPLELSGERASVQFENRDEVFDRASHEFVGWEYGKGTHFTSGARFDIAAGAIGLLLFHTHGTESPEPACISRSITLVTCTPDGTRIAWFPTANHMTYQDLFSTMSATITRDPSRVVRQTNVSNWTRSLVRTAATYVIRDDGRVTRKLTAVSFTARGVRYEFTPEEIREIEGSLDGVSTSEINRALNVARRRYGRSESSVRELVARTFEVPRATVDGAISWLAEYVRWHDGEG